MRAGCTARPSSARLGRSGIPRRSHGVIILQQEYVHQRCSLIQIRRTIASSCGRWPSPSPGTGIRARPSNRPWPPGVQKVPDDSPPLSPEDALKTFYMPPGYRLELVASEPLIQDPVAIDWDPEGRLWAVEMPGFMADVAGSNEHDPIGRVVVLEDTNADGEMDKRTVFADGLVLARSVKVLDRGVLVARAAERLADARHRTATCAWTRRSSSPISYGRLERRSAEQRQRLLLGARQLDAHGRAGRHPAAAEERRVRGAEDAAARRMGRDAGRRGPHLSQHERVGAARRLVPTAYFARNPNLLRTRGSYERLADEQRAEHRLAGAPESGHQPRVSDRHRSRRRIAGASSRRSARRSSIAATGCRRISTATCSSRSRRRTW